MIVDFDQLPRSDLECDVCVIGTGACGMTVGLEFLGGAERVILVESGGEKAEAGATDLQRGRFSARPHPGTQEGRARVLGGTTTLWGGQALPFFPIDFEARRWVPHSGWPLAPADLSDGWRRAAAVLGVPGAPFGEERAATLPAPPFPVEAGSIERLFSQWSPQPNFARAWRRRFAGGGNVDILLHASVLELSLRRDRGGIERVLLGSLSGRRGTLKARHFILCAGGIETARLLLASRREEAGGVGNRNDLVGRFFQDHVAVKCGVVHPGSRAALSDLFALHRGRAVRHLPKLRASDGFQRHEQILNVIGTVGFEWPEGSALPALRQFVGALLRGQRPRSGWLQAVPGPGELGMLVGMAGSQLFGSRAYLPPSGGIFLEAHCEQEPDAASRITLGDELDALGLPRSVVHWRPTAATWRSCAVFAQAVATAFARLGLGRLKIVLPAASDEAAWEAATSDTFHHMGTARMHDNPIRGVVDRNCRVHGLDNLFIGGAAVFPTGGCSNPTFTAMALCIRIADHVKACLHG